MRVRDIMVADVETVSPDDDVGDVLGRLARVDFSGFPVVDDAGAVVGIVTEHDLVRLFEPEDRVFWIPVGLPPFTETLEYSVNLSWDEFDLGFDAVRTASKPISSVMTTDVIAVGPDDDLDRLLALLGNPERDINRVPVVDDGRLVGIVSRQDVLRAFRDERGAGGN